MPHGGGHAGTNTEEMSSVFLKDQIGAAGAQRRALRPLRQANITSIATQEDRLTRRLRSAGSSAAAQAGNAGVADFSSALQDATRRAKVRSRIAQQGDEAIRSQALRDRVSVAKSGVARQGELLRLQGTARNIQFGVNAGVQDAQSRIAASNANLFGTIGGATTRLLSDPTSRQNAGNFFKNIFRPNNSVAPGQNGMLTPPPRTLPPGD